MTDTPDPVLVEMAAALALPADQARARLGELWDRATDPLHRCGIAHSLADLQAEVADELAWDERALAAVADVDDARVQAAGAGAQVAAFLPSLHTNLADDHRRLGDPDRARQHLALARASIGALGDDAYGDLLRSAVGHVQGALDAGSTDRLPTAPSS
ncbi:MAG: hypothetical protein F2825_06445 [Actinobacteria bacterium]|nr:hypothetical protein [Actinomycetota bacterium]